MELLSSLQTGVTVRTFYVTPSNSYHRDLLGPIHQVPCFSVYKAQFFFKICIGASYRTVRLLYAHNQARWHDILSRVQEIVHGSTVKQMESSFSSEATDEGSLCRQRGNHSAATSVIVSHTHRFSFICSHFIRLPDTNFRDRKHKKITYKLRSLVTS